MRKTLSRLVSIALLVLVAMFALGGQFGSLTSGKARDRQLSVHNATERDGRVQFRLMNTHFDIPRQYFKGVAVSGGGYAQSASLWALLPNFEGYDKAVNHHDFYEVHHKGRRIQIMLVPRGRRMTVPQMVVRDNARESGTTVFGGRHQGGKYDEIRYGLEYYHSDFNSRDSEYLYRINGIPILEFECDDRPPPPPPVKKYPGCKGYWDYNAEVAVNFDFSIEYLPEWRSIFTHIQQLLDGQLDVKPVLQSTITEKQGE